ncbi:hypothetical protein PM082_004001 [Marasmius tenuissimus]|nr:hypothetical protein PM082_004001 [Marasmius tenuissimus]
MTNVPVETGNDGSKNHPKKSRTAKFQFWEKRGSTVADVSITILTALKETAELSGVAPYVGTLSTLAIGIVNAAQGASDNRNSFNQLVCDTCSLVYNIGAVCKEFEPGKLSPTLISHLKTLTSTLEEIRDFAQRRADKAFWKLYLSAKSDLDRIQGFRGRLRQALDLFEVQSHIAVRGMVEQMDTRQKTIQEELRARRSDSDTALLCQGPNHRLLPSSLMINPSILNSDQNPTLVTSPISSPSATSSPFFGLASTGTFTGNVTVNNVSGNSHVVTNNNNRSTTNSRNVYNYTTANSSNRVRGWGTRPPQANEAHRLIGDY